MRTHCPVHGGSGPDPRAADQPGGFYRWDFPFLHRSGQESAHCKPGRGLCLSVFGWRLGGVKHGWRLVWPFDVYNPDLFRFFRLFRYGDWSGAAVWIPLCGKFQLPVYFSLRYRVLAQMAYFPGQLFPGLRLYSHGRQSAASVLESAGRLVFDRIVARRQLEFCIMGALFRRSGHFGKMGFSCGCWKNCRVFSDICI